MIQNFAFWLAEVFVEKGVCKPSEFEWAKYRSELFLGKWITYSLILLVALCFQDVLGAVLFILFFTSLKKYTGGYHAKTQFRCTLFSVLYYVLVHFLAQVVESSSAKVPILLGSLLLSGLVVFILSPINNPQLDLTPVDMAIYRRRALLCFGIESVSILGMWLLRVPFFYVATCALSVVLVSAAIVYAKIIKQEVEKNEN